MPVKWTSDNDQTLLLKILETHDLHVDAKKVVDAWPNDRGEIPTARAIKERLVRIRQNSKEAGAQHFVIGSSQTKSAGTPQASPSKTPSSSASKPKPTTGASSIATPSKRKREPGSTGPGRVKPEPQSDDDELVEISSRIVTPKGNNAALRASSSVTPFAAPLTSNGNRTINANSFATSPTSQSNKSIDYSFGTADNDIFSSASTPSRSMQSSWGHNTDSPAKYAGYGFDGTNDYYASFEDEVAV